MPLITQPVDSEQGEQEFTEDVLFTDKGTLTLESETLASFLDTVDFDPLFEHPDVKEFIETGPVLVIEDEAGRLVPILDEDVADGDDKKVMVVEYIDGEIAAEFIDEEDLSHLLAHYIRNEHPTESLEDRTALQQFADILEGDDAEALEEKFKAPFKKGDFRKGPMKGVSAASKGAGKKVYGQRVRMMVAMLKKGAITRVAKGTGYKGGDYKRGPGYGGGTKAGKSAYAAASVKDAKQAGNIQKMVDPGRRKVVQVIYKNLGKSMPKNWVPPERRGKHLKNNKIVTTKKVGVKAKTAPAVSKGKALFGGKGKKVDVAHVIGTNNNLSESASLAGRVMAVASHKRKPITEKVG